MLLTIKSLILQFLVAIGLCEPVPTVVLTFDFYPNAYTVAFQIMRDRGLPGTYFVDPNFIDRDISREPESKDLVISSDQLKEMQRSGWSIQGYTGARMDKFLATEGVEATRKKLQDIKTDMARKGFEITTIAPSGRQWNAELRDIAAPIYTAVRVVGNGYKMQSYPIKDKMWVLYGATNSLDETTTYADLSDQLDSIIKSNDAWFIVSHRAPGKIFEKFCDRLVEEQKAGRIRVVTFEQSLIQKNRWKFLN